MPCPLTPLNNTSQPSTLIKTQQTGKIVTRSAAIITIFMAITVIYGWYTDNQTLVQVVPTFAPMQYNTALGFLFSGIGGLLLSYGQFKYSRIFGILASILGASTLTQYIWEIDLGIDNFFVEPTFLSRTSHPGRMAPNTALSFTVLGLALFFGTFRPRRNTPFMIGLAFGVMTLAGLAFIGYAMPTDTMYGWGTLTRMAIHTTTAFMIMGAGVLIYGLYECQNHGIDRWKIIPLPITITLVLLSFFSWYSFDELARRSNEAHFSSLITDSEKILLERFALYEKSLRGGVGLYHASDNITRNEWRIFISALQPEKYLTGINGVGYIDYVKEEDLAQYIEHIKKKFIPDFTNHPDTAHPDKFVIRYIEPEANNIEAIGLDIGFETNRREAAEQARDLGISSLTKKILLVQDHEQKAGFLLLIPIYDTMNPPQTVKQRRKHIKGWIYAPFIGENFLNGLNEINNRQLGFEVYDGEHEISEDTLIYASGRDKNFLQNNHHKNDKTSDTIDDFHKHTTLNIAGRKWTILWYPGENYTPPFHKELGLMILIIGLLFSAFLYLTLKQMLHSKSIIQKEVLKRTQELEENKERYKAILDNTVDAIITADSNGIILSANQAAEKLFGYENDEIIGQNVNILMPEEHNIKHDSYIKRYQETGVAKLMNTTRELKGKRKNKNLFPITIALSEVKLEDKIIYSAIIRDITESKKNQELILNMYEELRRSSDATKQANQLKSEFLANMSHEIRTPLNGVIGAADLLSKTDIAREQKKYLDIITGSSDRLLGLINNILDLSKIEAGELTLQREPVIIRDLVFEIVQSVIQKTIDKDVEIITEYSDDVPHSIIADPIRIGQIFTNLLGNAVKFIDKGHIAIHIDAEPLGDDRIGLLFTIEDTGIGIPEDKLDSIFDKFIQADATTVKKYGGTGLGLAITQRLIEMMGGTIEVESTLDVGTTFTFDIPFDLNLGKEEEKDIQEDKAQYLNAIKDLHVLAVDDSPIILKSISATLHKLNITHETTTDPIDALERLKRPDNPYNVLFTDYQMPDLNGIDLAKELRNHPDTQKIKIILITAMGRMKLGIGEAENDLFDEQLFKPVYPDRILKSLYNVVTTQTETETETETEITTEDEPTTQEQLALHVLLVENEMVNQMIATDMLESIGCTVDLAENGQIAVDKFSEHPPGHYDAVLMDCMMPVMDGFEATMEIRRLEQEKDRPHQIIIAMTANAMADEKDKCIQVGMDDYLAKPVKEEDLSKKLKEHLN